MATDTVKDILKDEEAAIVQATHQDVDLASFAASGATLEEQAKAAVAACPITVFVKKSCPFCIEVQHTWDTLKVPYTAFDVTKTKGLQATLTSMTGQSTVPYVYIGQEFIGGCNDTKAMQADGRLQQRLAVMGLLAPPAPKAPAHKPVPSHNTSGVAMAPLPPHPISVPPTSSAISKSRPPRSLFNFPDTVDDRVARLNGVLGCIACILIAIFFRRTAAHWAMVGVLADFVARLLGCPSVISSLAQMIVAIMELFGSRPRWIAGPPKQFASLCGIMFSGLAVIFFMVAGKWSDYVGLAFTIGLAGATGMEGFLGFCLGCVFFSIGVDLGVFPANVYSVHLNSRAEAEYTWNENNKRLNEGEPQKRSKPFDPEQPTAVDLAYKAKTDDMTREDFSPVKHVKITHWIMHASLVMLAVTWSVASDVINAPNTIWHVLGIAAATWYTGFLGLYLLRTARFPRKMCKEWMCNLRGNAFFLPLLCLPLYAYLISPWSIKFARFLFWLGAGPTMALSIVRVGDWIAHRKELEHLNGGWMLVPAANFVAAFVGPMLDGKYVNAMQFYFAFGIFLWMLLFPITFFRAIVHMDNDDRVRPLLAIWPASTAIAALAYPVVFPPMGGALRLGLAVLTGTNPLQAALGASSNVFICLYWFSVALFLVFLWCLYRPYFGRMKFDMNYWAAGLPTSAIAMAALLYHALNSGRLGQGIALLALAITSSLNLVLICLTFASILRRGVFVPDYKWGPISFMRLTHEAIRGAMAAIHDATEALATEAGSAKTAGAEGEMEKLGGKGSKGVGALAMQLVAMWEDLEWVHAVHSFHEDEVIFPAYEEFFPGVAAGMDHEHATYHETAANITAQLQSLLNSCSSGSDETFALVDDITRTVPVALKALEDHLRSEEDDLQPVPRRYLPLAVHKEVVRNVFTRTPALTWFKMVPWVVNSLPMHGQRVRFLKTLLWALPERAQQLGTMVALGTDPVQWVRITDDLPELIPRGADGWQRYY